MTDRDQIHLLRVGWRNFFPVVLLCVSFLVLAGNRFWCYILMYLEYNTVVQLWLEKITTGKKGTVVWPSVGMFGGSMSSDCFGGFLDQITIKKKGTVVWPSVAMFGGLVPWARIILAGLSLCFSVGSLIKLQIMTGKKVQSSGHWLECLLRTFDSFWMGVVLPASSLLSKSIRKVSITATCRLEWHYQLSKKIMAFSLSNIEIQWFFFQVDS